MKRPPDFMMPILQSIESIVVNLYKEFPRLIDKDVEKVYQQLGAYFKQLSTRKDVEEPLSSSTMKQALIDEILNVLDVREEINADASSINNPTITLNGQMVSSIESLYVPCFKQLEQSARFWRKREGRTGYLRHIVNFIP